MPAKLKNKVDTVMYFLDRKSKNISKIYVVYESQSGNSVQTSDGTILRTHTKNQSIFFSLDMANSEQFYLKCGRYAA